MRQMKGVKRCSLSKYANHGNITYSIGSTVNNTAVTGYDDRWLLHIMEISSYHIQALNLYVICLKLIKYYVSIIVQFLKKEKIPSNNIYCQPYARDRMRSW